VTAPQIQDAQDIRVTAAEIMAKDLLSSLVTEIKLLPDIWEKLVQEKQNDIIERLRKTVIQATKNAVHIIASQGHAAIPGELEQILIKDGAKATVKIIKEAQSLHNLCEFQGSAVFIVCADHLQYLSGVQDIQGEADQRSFDMGREYTDVDGADMEETTVTILPAPKKQADAPKETEQAS